MVAPRRRSAAEDLWEALRDTSWKQEATGNSKVRLELEYNC
jgi:hypothetical protein